MLIQKQSYYVPMVNTYLFANVDIASISIGIKYGSSALKRKEKIVLVTKIIPNISNMMILMFIIIIIMIVTQMTLFIENDNLFNATIYIFDGLFYVFEYYAIYL